MRNTKEPTHARRCGRRGGFTLIEILVVMAIIMGLVTVVTVNVLQKQQKARVDTAKIQVRELQNAVGHYQVEQGRIPTMEQGLDSLVRKPASSPVPETYPDGGYLASRRLPRDPWGREFIYLVPGREGLPFEIVCYGSDGEPGGDGDAADISTADL
ncbi:MAG: type II secretion system protein GspG [Lentisphaerae bacterium]|nr:type II secretion system protein GspG [Lentisphaerota bacterium]